MPAHRNGAADSGAGVRKPPGKEPARSGGKRAPRMLWGFRDSGLAARRRRTAWRRAGWAGDGVELWRQAGSASAIRRRVRLHPVRSAWVRTSAIAAGPWPAVAPGIAAVGGWKHHEVSIPMVGAWLGWQPASAGRLAGAIEQAGDPLVGHLARQLAHERQRLLAASAAPCRERSSSRLAIRLCEAARDCRASIDASSPWAAFARSASALP